MSPNTYRLTRGGIRFPRGSGDEPALLHDMIDLSKFSPRERG